MDFLRERFFAVSFPLLKMNGRCGDYFAMRYLRHHQSGWRPEKVLLAGAFIAHTGVSFTADAPRPAVLIPCEKESLGWVMEPNVDTIGAQYSATDYTPTYRRPIFVTVWRQCLPSPPADAPLLSRIRKWRAPHCGEITASAVRPQQGCQSWHTYTRSSAFTIFFTIHRLTKIVSSTYFDPGNSDYAVFL